MVSTLAWIAIDVGSIPTCWCNGSNLYHLHDTGCHNHEPLRTMHCMVAVSTPCMDCDVYRIMQV